MRRRRTMKRFRMMRRFIVNRRSVSLVPRIGLRSTPPGRPPPMRRKRSQRSTPWHDRCRGMGASLKDWLTRRTRPLGATADQSPPPHRPEWRVASTGPPLSFWRRQTLLPLMPTGVRLRVLERLVDPPPPQPPAMLKARRTPFRLGGRAFDVGGPTCGMRGRRRHLPPRREGVRRWGPLSLPVRGRRRHLPPRREGVRRWGSDLWDAGPTKAPSASAGGRSTLGPFSLPVRGRRRHLPPRREGVRRWGGDLWDAGRSGRAQSRAPTAASAASSTAALRTRSAADSRSSARSRS